MASNVLIIEDENDIARITEHNCRRAGYETRVANDGETGLTLARKHRPDLILLDVMLPDISGFEVLKRLQSDNQTSSIPVVMLTARGDEVDRVLGFELGAKDYVLKPFSVRELVLRIRVALKRESEPTLTDNSENGARVGVIYLDEQSHRCFVRDQEVVLTALEFRLLSTFMSRLGRVQTRQQLLSDVWGISAEIETRTVDTHISRLREILGEAGDYIHTVRGIGYRMMCLEEQKQMV